MTPKRRRRWEQADAIFARAIELEPGARVAFLDESCAGDEQLRRLVEQLLNPESGEDPVKGSLPVDFISRILLSVEGSLDSTLLMQPVGSYRLLREIGRGGMGVVYLAERADSQYEKQVAIKLIKRGMDTEEIISRFVYERQILASLDHPNIACLYDGGVTEDGRPFFVMEYVEGKPITVYCDEHRLTTLQRLALFRTVCRAVQYAHQNLVIHRDLKPSNILVTEDGMVKLLDFGIAKLLDEEAQVMAPPATRTGLQLLTPEYASPEQIEGKSVTTASDVYALGVLLYELLSGHQPYRIVSRAWEEIRRIILETVPPQLSTAVSRTEEVSRSGLTKQITPEVVSKARSTTPEKLRRQLVGDLDNIVSMAQCKEPQQRYGTVEQFAEDIRRHLVGLPVIAQKPTRAYRFRKFVQRHKVGVSATAAIAVLLMTVALLAIFFAVREKQQAERIASERDKAEEVSDFLMKLFEANDPNEAKGDTITARELLERGIRRVEELNEQPIVQAQMLDVVGRVFHSLGQYAKAEQSLRQALALRRELRAGDLADVAESLNNLASVLHDQGEYEEAEQLYREALAMRQELSGAEDVSVAETMNDLALLLHDQGNLKRAEELYREALAIDRKLLGREHTDVTTILNNLAMVLRDKGDFEEAEELYREAIAIDRKGLGDEHMEVAFSLNNLAMLLHDKGDFKEAEGLYREALTIQRKLLGAGHAHRALALTMNNLAVLLHDMGDYNAAEPLYREVLATQLNLLNAEHPDVGQSLNNLAFLLMDGGNYQEAEELYREALAILRKQLGEEHRSIASVLTNMGVLQRRKGDYATAEPLLREALRMRHKLLNPEHQDVAGSLSHLALLLYEKGDTAAAEPLFRRALDLFRKALPKGHPYSAGALVGLGSLLCQQGDVKSGEPLLQQAVEIRRKALVAGHWEIAQAENALSRCLAAPGRGE